MRLLKQNSDGEFVLTPPLSEANRPFYAILSHTWGPDADEVTYQDLQQGTGKNKNGYEKMRFCAEQARRKGLVYFWIDTCCINKTDLVELSEAINSMFNWYRKALQCWVYLSDVHSSTRAWEPAFRMSRWWRRGWTLQELIAPASVVFYDRDGTCLGDKVSLEKQICEIAGIPGKVLRGKPLASFSVEERFKWAERRQTSRAEDMAYCLQGIFGVFMAPLYGEGRNNAVRRLRKEVDDDSYRKHESIYHRYFHFDDDDDDVSPAIAKAKSTDVSSSDLHLSYDSYDSHNIAREKSAEYDNRLITELPSPGLQVQSMRCLRTLTSHFSPLTTIAVSPDSKLLASATLNRTITVRALNSFKRVAAFSSGQTPASALGFPPSTLRLIAASPDTLVGIWNLATQQCESQKRAKQSFVTRIALSADAALLAIDAGSGTIEIWNARNLTCLRILTSCSREVHELAFSRDSRLIAVRIHSIIEVWDTEAGDLLAFFCGSPDQYFQSITVSSDLKLVAAGDLNGGITFWSFMEQDKNDIVTSSHRDCVHSVAFSPDSKFLASASRDRTIKIWNTATLVCLKSLEGHRGDVNSVVFTPDGKLLISASDDMTIRVWGTELPT